MQTTELLLQAARTLCIAAAVSAFVLFVKSVKPYDLSSGWYYLVLLPALAAIAVLPHGWEYLLASGAGYALPLFGADILGTLAGFGAGWVAAKLLQLSLRD